MTDNVITLPRGGYLVDTPAGYIQFGSPPETIKDTMRMERDVPGILVLPFFMFNWLKGISVGEIEFPLYYNFFLRKKKTVILCREDQFQSMKKVLQEALFGPEMLNIAADYATNGSTPNVPDLKREMNYFRNNLKLADLVSFGIFRDNRFTIKGVTISITKDENYEVHHGGELIAEIPAEIEYKPKYKIGERLSEPYVPPLFGVTCLGPSHGFDPDENTSGFILWLDHQGLMVDPPVDSTEWLESSNVNPKLIDSIILTHCHADHDAGTFQKILEEGKVKVYATETVIMSFLRKYSQLSGVDISYLMKLFTFHPVKIGTPVFIHNARFDFFYTLHSIPTLGFKMEFQDQSFVYSSDHNNDPELHNKLLEEGVITRERYDELRNFPWDSKVIYHESGIAPLHTPIRYLNSMPVDMQKRIVVYHIAKKDFPAKTDLTLATFGMEHTLYFTAATPRFEDANRILEVLKHLDFLHGLPVEKAQEFLNIVEEEHYTKGDVIIKKGSKGDKFFIIYSGNVSVDSGGLEEKKLYGTYDYFGEVALVTEGNRAADVMAETDVTVYTVARDKFLNFIVGTDFEHTLHRLARVRSSETWNLLSQNPFFQRCSSSQKTWLESIFIPMEKKGAGTLLQEGKPIDFIYLIREGEVEVSKEKRVISRLERGDLIGSLQKIHRGEPSSYTFSHPGTVSLYAMKAEDIFTFVENNPGMLMKQVNFFLKNQ